MKCNKNTCPTGITTHDPRLQRGLNPQDKAVRVSNFVKKIRYGAALSRTHAEFVIHAS